MILVSLTKKNHKCPNGLMYSIFISHLDSYKAFELGK